MLCYASQFILIQTLLSQRSEDIAEHAEAIVLESLPVLEQDEAPPDMRDEQRMQWHSLIVHYTAPRSAAAGLYCLLVLVPLIPMVQCHDQHRAHALTDQTKYLGLW